MLYNDFKGKKLSSLGLGCMRFPANDDDSINVQITREMVDCAIKNGINYFDTAWGYHNGRSESVIGEILSSYPRESFYLATKFPGYDTNNMEKCEEIFEKQLEKCKVDYFDFYLFHNVCDRNIGLYLDPKYGLMDYLLKQKENGRIRHLGFSAHARVGTMKRFLDAYGKHLEFCQLQINYLDWSYQNAKEKVELVTSYGLPVWVMEPVRGGGLAKLNENYIEKLRKYAPDRTPAEWAFRFIQSIPEVKMTLSGMSNFEQLRENIKIFSENKPVSQQERNVLFDIAQDMTGKNLLPCTSCKYCTSYCQKGLDIPKIIEIYNENIKNGNAPIDAKKLDIKILPSACVSCKECEKVCPQTIKISDMMRNFTEKLINE